MKVVTNEMLDDVATLVRFLAKGPDDKGALPHDVGDACERLTHLLISCRGVKGAADALAAR